MKGTYCLLINLNKSRRIKIGKLGTYYFPKGNYVYVGSGMNNIEKRVARHKSKQKKNHWHIDYLLNHARITNTIMIPAIKKNECEISKLISTKETVRKFGSTDCKCRTHLHYFKTKEEMSKQLKGIAKQGVMS